MIESVNQEFILGLMERRPRYQIDSLPCEFWALKAHLPTVVNLLSALLSQLEDRHPPRDDCVLRVEQPCREKQGLVKTNCDVTSEFSFGFALARLARLQDLGIYWRAAGRWDQVHQVTGFCQSTWEGPSADPAPECSKRADVSRFTSCGGMGIGPVQYRDATSPALGKHLGHGREDWTH